MEPIPDCWPPDDPTLRSAAPLFPLPGVFLFPNQLLPLHVFEPRYRQMVEDCLDGPGRIVIGTTVERPHAEGPGADAGVPQVLEVAGIGEILRHDKLEDGCYNIWLLGLMRVRITEVASDRLYRRVLCAPFEEIDPSPADIERLQPLLVDATSERTSMPLSLPDGTSTGVLTDLLVQTLRVPQSVVEDIYTEERVTERARKALAAHVRYPPKARS